MKSCHPGERWRCQVDQVIGSDLKGVFDRDGPTLLGDGRCQGKPRGEWLGAPGIFNDSIQGLFGLVFTNKNISRTCQTLHIVLVSVYSSIIRWVVHLFIPGKILSKVRIRYEIYLAQKKNIKRNINIQQGIENILNYIYTHTNTNFIFIL